MDRWRATLENAGNALCNLAGIGAFVALGMAFAAVDVESDPTGAGEAPYPAAFEEDARVSPPDSPASVWLIDGFNVLHAGVLGGRDRSEWWTEARRASSATTRITIANGTSTVTATSRQVP